MLETIKKNPMASITTLLAILSVSVSPLAFVASAATNYSFHFFAIFTIVPAALIFFLLIPISLFFRWRWLSQALIWGIVAGILGTFVMEIVRATGFRLFNGMPGSLPMLMGVLMTGRIMDGPNILSNVIGWSDHFFNGIGFATLYLLLIGRSQWWLGVVYALTIGTIFMLSPVMNIIGAGYFGQEFAPIRFPLTVYAAHFVYGFAVGFIAAKAPRLSPGIIPVAWQKLKIRKQ